jgi:hypothetical protein
MSWQRSFPFWSTENFPAKTCNTRQPTAPSSSSPLDASVPALLELPRGSRLSSTQYVASLMFYNPKPLPFLLPFHGHFHTHAFTFGAIFGFISVLIRFESGAAHQPSRGVSPISAFRASGHPCAVMPPCVKQRITESRREFLEGCLCKLVGSTVSIVRLSLPLPPSRPHPSRFFTLGQESKFCKVLFRIISLTVLSSSKGISARNIHFFRRLTE